MSKVRIDQPEVTIRIDVGNSTHILFRDEFLSLFEDMQEVYNEYYELIEKDNA